jgi:hypothetical protein
MNFRYVLLSVWNLPVHGKAFLLIYSVVGPVFFGLYKTPGFLREIDILPRQNAKMKHYFTPWI